ncbi:MAG: hypothetical protein HC913_09350 [Microscillaceae bacterium]|nr:hypothetical protein [Microscillaceae bacterium]
MIVMQNLSEYISELRNQPEIWAKVAPLVEHITYLEAELRLAKLNLDEKKNAPKAQEEMNRRKFSTVRATPRNKDLSLEERNLYRAVGELAFVIARADNILEQEERKAFHEVVLEELGEHSWIAEDRFQLIAETPASDVESTYHHVMYLIWQNQRGLTKELVHKFISVICRVAEVANIHKNQQGYIDRFRHDLHQIFPEAEDA